MALLARDRSWPAVDAHAHASPTQVRNDAPDTPDQRMRHEACNVTRGHKFGANIWIRQYQLLPPRRQNASVPLQKPSQAKSTT